MTSMSALIIDLSAAGVSIKPKIVCKCKDTSLSNNTVRQKVDWICQTHFISISNSLLCCTSFFLSVFSGHRWGVNVKNIVIVPWILRPPDCPTHSFIESKFRSDLGWLKTCPSWKWKHSMSKVPLFWITRKLKNKKPWHKFFFFLSFTSNKTTEWKIDRNTTLLIRIQLFSYKYSLICFLIVLEGTVNAMSPIDV